MFVPFAGLAYWFNELGGDGGGLGVAVGGRGGVGGRQLGGEQAGAAGAEDVVAEE
jgi:hypothetical protein